LFWSFLHYSSYKLGSSYGARKAFEWLSNKEILSWSGKDLYVRVASVYRLTHLERIYFLFKLKSLDPRLYDRFTTHLLTMKHSSIPYYLETGDEWHWFGAWEPWESSNELIDKSRSGYLTLIDSYSTFVNKSVLISFLDLVRGYRFSFEDTCCYYFWGIKAPWNLKEIKGVAEVLVMLIDNKILARTTGGFKFVGADNPDLYILKVNGYEGYKPKFDFRVISNSVRYRFSRRE